MEGQLKGEEGITKQTLDTLVNTLKMGDSFERGKAIEVLIERPSKGAVDRLIPLLEDKDTNIRMAAWEVLKRIGNHHMDAILSLLEHPNEDVRVYACEIVGALKHKDTLPHLIDRLKDESPNVRNIACICLEEFKEERAVDALLEVLKEGDNEWISFSAIESLGKIGNKKAIEPLLNIFKEKDNEISLAAAEALIAISDDEAIGKMLDCLKGWDKTKRDMYIKVILEGLSERQFQMIKERMGEELFEYLFDAISYEGRKSLHLINLIAHFKRIETCDIILNTIVEADPDTEEYGHLIEAFACLKEVWSDHLTDYFERDERYIPHLINACKVADVKVDESILLPLFIASPVDIKREIIEHLPLLLSGTAINLLREAIYDSDGHVKGDAMLAAGQMGMREFEDEISNTARTGYMDVREKALKSLIRLDYKEGKRVSEEFVIEGSADDKRVYLSAAGLMNAEDNYPLIRLLLSDEDERIRRRAVDLIGDFLYDKRYIELIEGLLSSDDIPHEALKIVKEKGLSIFKERLIEVFTDKGIGLWTRYYALSALAIFEDPQLFNIFMQGLDDESEIIKIACIKALADLDDQRALESIRPFLDSENDDLRMAAEEAIARLEGS